VRVELVDRGFHGERDEGVVEPDLIRSAADLQRVPVPRYNNASDV
jgi:hypothetical protein